MKILEGLQELLEAAAERGAARALEQAAASPRRLVPLKSAGVSYRLLLDAERRGELRVYRRGHGSFVALDELEAWIMAAPRSVESAEDPHDEIGALISMNDSRRRRRSA